MDPLVLLHGFTGRGRSWDPFLEALKDCSLPAGVDGWSPDLPGHGSSSEARPESFEATVDELAGRMARRFDRPMVLVGYSLGARLALGIALKHPRRVRHLVLIGVQPGIPLVEDRRRRADADAAMADRILRDGIEDFVTYWQNRPVLADQKRLPTEMLVPQTQDRLSHHPEGLAWAARTLSQGLMPDYRQALGEWEGGPITLITGSLDDKYTEISQEIRDLVPGAVHHVIEGAGHNPVLERPREVAALVGAVLAGHAFEGEGR